MLISDLLKPEQIKLELANEKRTQAIHEVAVLLQGNSNVVQFQGFYDELLARERVESTCLGNEIAFPHARTDHLKGMVLAVGRSTEGVLFENSNQMVRLIFVIGTPKRMATDYLSVVGGLARLLKDTETRQQLMQANTPAEFIEAVESAEKKF
jgi:mannitol/fructose-specific phosphotransferase system IIA component (Ntr-type)